MKIFLRHVLINLLVLYFTDLFYPGLSLPHDFKTLLSASVIWLLLNKIVKPVIKLFLLPLSLVTLGLFSWIVNVIVLFIMTKLVSGLSVTGFTLAATNYSGFAAPALSVNPIVSYILASVLISLIYALLNKFMVRE